ncbi:MAG: flagellin [Opitutae bacterium]|nr:flagellin [Opitutae bacterium]|tara:strand:+ start:1620 stop:2534 length:915 start_codon:yes stop_codon:yes gene_type:complete
MSITINTNMAAARASFQLTKNNNALQKSLNRLSSGSRITKPADDAGGLAVAMKLKGSINRLKGVEANVGNAISFLQVQDGILESSGKILDRMAELKALSQDVLKNSSDIANYDSEFSNLQVQLHQMASTKFNGVSLFGTGVAFGSSNTNMKSIITSADGETTVSINQSQLLSALTIDTSDTTAPSLGSALHSAANGSTIYTFATADSTNAIKLSSIDAGVYTKALENIATLRSENGASVSRLMFAEEAAQQRRTNLEAAHGRIMDVDIASESTALAKNTILVQASASMLVQANQSASIALSLLA